MNSDILLQHFWKYSPKEIIHNMIRKKTCNHNTDKKDKKHANI